MDNDLSILMFERKKQTPAKTWWEQDIFHPAIARALKVDRSEMGGVFALAPFRLFHDGEKHVILAPFPAPRMLGPVDHDWLDIATVIAWNPQDDTAEIMGDVQPQLVGNFDDSEQGTIFSSPRDFFTQWMMDRAAFFVRWMQSRKGEWAHGATERDLTPGKLAVGDINKIRWSGLPDTIHCRGLSTQEVNRAILRQANLPRAVSQNQRMVA